MDKIFKGLFIAIVMVFVLGVGVGTAKTDFIYINSIETFSEEYQFKNLSALFVDGDELYVADHGGSRIYVFELDGTPIFQFGEEKGLRRPTDFFVYKDRIFVSQEGKRAIDIFNIRGDKIGEIDPPFEEFVPHRLALGEGGTFFVVDKLTMKICAFDVNGKYLYSFGGRDVLKSMGAITSKGEKIYVTVMDSFPLVRVFNTKGKYLAGFGQIGDSKELFSMPSSIKVDEEGLIWIADAYKHSVRAFNQEGKMQKGFGEGSLHYPINVDFRGDLFFVLEKEKKRVSMFKWED